VILLGLYLGELTERTGSIWPAIVCHTVNNSLSTLLAPFAGREMGGASAADQGPTVAAITLGVCATVLVLSLFYVMRRPLAPVEDARYPESGTGFDVLPYAVPQPPAHAPPAPYQPPYEPPRPPQWPPPPPQA
jgi:hypothetical protein